MTNESISHGQSKSKLWVGLALFVTLALVFYTAYQDKAMGNDVVAPMTKSQTHAKSTYDASKNTTSNNTKSVIRQQQADKNIVENVNANPDELIDWKKLNREEMIENSNDLFKSHSWVVAPSAPARQEPPPPPPPVAPPVPFNYMGRLDNGPKGNLIYLATMDQSYSVILGNNVDGFWKLEKEDADNLYFTYLPLDLPQVLSKHQQLAMPAQQASVVNAFK